MKGHGKTGTGRTRVQRFLGALGEAREVWVVTHDNPDPDAIASGWALCVLAGEKLGVPTRLTAGGIISRAENRALVEILKPPLRLGGRWPPPEDAAVVVVDTAFLPRLEALARRGPLAAVIDHHENHSVNHRRLSFLFRDVRPRVVAASSMVSGYLRECGIRPDAALATALTYGIYSDAKSIHPGFTREDSRALSWLAQYSDPELLSQIENPALPRTYYEDLLLALECCFTFDEVAICFLPRASCAEAVGEVADLLVRCEGIQRLLCAGVVGRRMVFSARTIEVGENATVILGKTLKGEPGASWGGHEHRAGGDIDLSVSAPPSELESKVRQNWLLANGVERHRGARLVPKREILRALK